MRIQTVAGIIIRAFNDAVIQHGRTLIMAALSFKGKEFVYNFQWNTASAVGDLELVGTDTTVEGTLILMSEWKAKLPAYLGERPV